MQIDIVVRGDRQAADLVERLSRRLEDGRPQLLGLVDMLLQSERRRFGGAVRWKQLARSTTRRDARGHRDPRPMRLTGRLAQSLTVRGAPGQILRVTPTSLRFGTSVYYASFHQRGKGVPKRTLVGLTRTERRDLVSELRHLLLEDL
jgi:phage gpG-like protein